MTHKGSCNVFYPKSTTSGVGEILSSVPRIGHPKDQKQGCALWSHSCWNLEAPSPTRVREYERID